MYCWYCGTKLPGAAAFCHRCGQSQDLSAAYDPAAVPLAPDGWPWSSPQATEPRTLLSPDQTAAAPIEAPPLTSPLTVVVDVVDPVSTTTVSGDGRTVDRATPPSRLAGLLGIACGLLVVAGSVGPWVTTRIAARDPVAIRGSEGDGRFTLWCGLAAVIFLALLLAAPRRGGWGLAAAGAFFLAALIGIADWTNVADRLDELARLDFGSRFEAEIAWGLPAVTLGSLAGLVLAVAQALQSRRAVNEP